MLTIHHRGGVGTAERLIEAEMMALEMSESIPGHFDVYRDGIKIAGFIHGKRVFPARARQRAEYTRKPKVKAATA